MPLEELMACGMLYALCYLLPDIRLEALGFMLLVFTGALDTY